MINTRILTVSLLVLLFVSNQILAEDRGYQVELIVFTQDSVNTEEFDQTTSKINWPVGVSEVSDQKRATNTTLDESFSLLTKDPNYQVILYSSWIQTLSADGIGAPVKMHSADGQLNGYLQLLQEQTLQVAVDFEYPSGRSDNFGNIVLYRLHEKRPVKLDDIHYLDHPKMGAIVKITAR